MRNVYPWMAQPRLRGYQKKRKHNYTTEFDRWMREVDMNAREVALALDIPEQRVKDLQAGWRNGRLNGGLVPSFATRYAMAALLEGLNPIGDNPDCYDLRDRLGQAGFDAGLEPWPAGDKYVINPYQKQPGRFRKLPVVQPPPAPKSPPVTRPTARKRVLVPKV